MLNMRGVGSTRVYRLWHQPPILEKSLSEESAALLGDNGVAACCTNVIKNLQLVATNFTPIRQPRPVKSGARETGVDGSLLERLKSKARSCIQDLESTLHLIEGSMQDVDLSEYLHFHLPSKPTITEERALQSVDSNRKKPTKEKEAKFRSDQKPNLHNTILILNCWMTSLPQTIRNEIRILEEEKDRIFEINMHILCHFDVGHVYQTTVGAKSAFLKGLWNMANSEQPEPATPEAVNALDEKFTRLKARAGNFTSDVLRLNSLNTVM
ncbi:unnamed protein product [Dibothriocephalus latus]|uniref:Uncharacterized protein n=1 Tax=Dibothriocephalus latus TaxID=60516 RepID=A0A3P7MF36_DIBLA|nr:unnamed protein product [Dibothriocephalus latus]